MDLVTSTRNSDLGDLVPILQREHDVQLDAVVPAQAITSIGGVLHVAGLGVFGDTLETIDQPGPGRFIPTAAMDGQIAESLGVPVKYLRRLRAERIDLYDINVNAWLQGRAGDPDGLPEIGPDGRSFLFRSFRDPEGGIGIGRALLSDHYKRHDNLDFLLGALRGVKESGVHCDIYNCDLSELRMVVRFHCPEVKVVAQALLANYRDPFEGGQIARWRGIAGREGMAYTPGTEPIISAGWTISNSETGGGATTIVPEVTVEICKNRLRITQDILRSIHLGGRNEDGVIDWSSETERLALALTTSKTTDAIKTFCNVEYLSKVVAALEEKASKRLSDPGKAVEIVANQLSFTEAEQADLLTLFINGGQSTAGGILQACSALAQTVESPDRAYEIEGLCMKSLELAYAAA
jgi:hypothetical protein